MSKEFNYEHDDYIVTIKIPKYDLSRDEFFKVINMLIKHINTKQEIPDVARYELRAGLRGDYGRPNRIACCVCGKFELEEFDIFLEPDEKKWYYDYCSGYRVVGRGIVCRKT